VEAGLDPMFGVLDQGNADVLQYQVIDDVLRARLTDHDNDTLTLAQNFGLSRVKQQLAELLAQRHDAHFHRWLTATPEEIVATWKEHYQNRTIPAAIGEIAAAAPIDEILTLLQGVGAKKPLFIEAKQTLLELLPRLKTGQVDPAEIAVVLQYARVKTDGPFICTAKDWDNDKEAYDRYSKACKKLRDRIEKLMPSPWDDAAALEAAELGLALLRLAAVVADEYKARKESLSLLDFDDLLAHAHRLMTDPAHADLRRRLAQRVRMILVDEFQDTDQLQVELVTAICGPESDRLFFVGDFKQSIYRFRGAEPHVFRDLQSKVREPGRQVLTVNFRSQPAILSFVNALFCEAIDNYQPLQPNRPQQAAAPSVEFLWTIDPNKNSHAKGAAQESRRREAHKIARRLCDLLDPNSNEQPVIGKGEDQARRAKPGDVAILFRALSDIRLYEEALRAHGLEYYLVGGHAFYAQQEIYDVLNLLRCVASSADEVSLAGVLRSPFFALTDESLFWLVDKHPTLNAGLLADPLPTELSNEERAKVAAAATTLRQLRAIKDRVPIAALLGEALAHTGYDAVLLAEFLGERKLANLQKLLEQARAADRGGVIELDGFITQLAQFVAREPREPLAATCPETADVIRLMTIHHAKGLEFPLVVIPDLDRPPHVPTPPAALDRNLGPLVSLPADDEREKSATGIELFTAQERQAEREERRRLLYVAGTRAADYLILSSSLEDYGKPKSDWMELIADRFDVETGTSTVELPAGYETPGVRISPPPTGDQKQVGKSRGPDLIHLLEDARQLAAEKGGTVPPQVAPIAVDRTARQQFSFSRLTGQLVRSDVPRAAPDAGSTEPEAMPIDPRDFGSLVHDVLERINFAGKPADIRRWCEQLAPDYVPLNADQAAADASELVERFTKSSRAAHLAQANVLHRETEFLLAWPPNRYVQGYIDCLYQDATGDWYIIDYKTNDVTAAEVAREARKYEMQMYVYALAAERTLGRPPAELAIHFLRPGTEHTFDWNENARKRATEMVNQAITEFESLTSHL
ncbi:MAG: 3'-5' exonuclease, partial [Pirellulales bacterium]